MNEKQNSVLSLLVFLDAIYVMLFKMVLNLKSLDKILKCTKAVTIQMKATELYCPVVLFIVL